jgi:uncharacterized protein YrrD
MILLGSHLLKAPIVSIQTGAVIGQADRAVIDPGKLLVVAYEVKGPLITKHPAYIRVADVRELSDMGIIIDSTDELVYAGDVIKLDEVEQYHFSLIGMHVIDEKRKKLGKIADYTIDMGSFYIQQLTVRRPLMQSLNDTELLIHRTQIIEINNNAIVVHSQAKAPEPERSEVLGSYVNPFRKQAEDAPEITTPGLS